MIKFRYLQYFQNLQYLNFRIKSERFKTVELI